MMPRTCASDHFSGRYLAQVYNSLQPALLHSSCAMENDAVSTLKPILLEGSLMQDANKSKLLMPHPEGLGTMMRLTEGSSLRGTVFNLVNTIIGGGILGLPYAVRQCGIVLGGSLLVLFAVFTDLAVWMLLVCVDATRQQSFALVGEALYGPSMGIAVDLAVFLNNLGVLTSYVVVIGDLVPPFMAHVSAPKLFQDRTSLLCMSAAFILLPLSCLRSMGALRHASLICLFMIWMLMVLVVAMGTGVIDVSEASHDSPRLFAEDPLAALAQLPVMVFAYNCNMNVPILYAELRRQKDESVDSKFRTKRSKMMAGMHTSILACVSIYCAVAIFGYMAFVEQTEGDILVNFRAPTFGPAPLVKASYSLVLICSYPVMCFSCVASLHRLLLHFHAVLWQSTSEADSYTPFMAASPRDRVPSVGSIAEPGLFPSPNLSPASSSTAEPDCQVVADALPDTQQQPSRSVHLTEVTALVALTLVLGILLPDVSSVFGITGGLCGGALTFIFPGLFYVKVAEQSSGLALWPVLGHFVLWMGLAMTFGTTLLVIGQMM
eukprot:gb/GFBE01046068.1/.p1 GENE.gb/GFBE01046068.1/~~gb/GFBE01046068.1/.p1  ORF type:complete len:548 (+),score=91.12 gb/GFBE01046068.1/:1-1644(+)